METGIAMPAVLKRDSGSASAWLENLRGRGMAAFEADGIPSPVLERWKYTNLPPFVRDFDTPPVAADLVIKQGEKLVQKLGDICTGDAPEWLVSLLKEMPPDESRYHDMGLWNLCNSHPHDGLLMDIAADQSVDNYVGINSVGHENALAILRMVFRLGARSHLTVVEDHTGRGRYWNNALTQIVVESGATMRHYRIQSNSPHAVYTQNTHVKVKAGGHYEFVDLSAGSVLSRNQIHVDLLEPEASCNLYGISLVDQSRLSDTTITVAHRAPCCSSRQFMRSVLKDRGHGVFQGKVHVHKDAQKTDAYQLSNALLLSEGAEMDTKPELEIYADDVKCTHGATTGQLDEEALFYMRSRGIPYVQARAILMESFVDEIVNKIGDNSVRNLVREKVKLWLGH